MNDTRDIEALLKPALEELSYEQAFTLLEEIVIVMETEEYPLDQALELFERGQALSRYCAERLDGAELKVQQISNGEIIDLDSVE